MKRPGLLGAYLALTALGGYELAEAFEKNHPKRTWKDDVYGIVRRIKSDHLEGAAAQWDQPDRKENETVDEFVKRRTIQRYAIKLIKRRIKDEHRRKHS